MTERTAELDWEAIATKLRPYIRSRVRTPADADDVLQEALIRVHRGLDGLEDEGRLGGWLHRIAANAVADHGRRLQRRGGPLAEAPESTDDWGAASASESQDDDALTQEIMTQSVAHFVVELPSPYREAITLVELEGLSHRRAAERVGISVSGMKSRVQRGRRMLRALLEQCCEIALDRRNRVTECRSRMDDCACE